MGPVGFEPTTKGFTMPRRFRREWTISSPAHVVCVWVRDARACHQGHLRHHTLRACSALPLRYPRPQVVSAPSGGAPPARLRIAMCAALRATHEGFPEVIPFTSRVSARRHLFDESPALTAVLQAQREAL